MRKITMETLQKIGACIEGKDAFQKRFPGGATWEARLAVQRDDEGREWVVARWQVG